MCLEFLISEIKNSKHILEMFLISENKASVIQQLCIKIQNKYLCHS